MMDIKLIVVILCVNVAQCVSMDTDTEITLDAVTVQNLVSTVQSLKHEVGELNEKVKVYENERRTRRLVLDSNQEMPQVAFSAFVRYYQDSVGLHQVIKFDGVTLNDGQAYSSITGVFTVPISGVYLVSYFIADRGINQAVVQLTVDNVGMSDAAAETIQSGHIDQGGNVVMLHLTKGQSMWVEVEDHAGIHIESASNWRFTTFSAVLLYEKY